MSRKLYILAFIALTITISSCRLFNPSVMLKTDKNYAYSLANDTVPKDHIIQPGDIVNFRLYPNQGFKIIDITALDDGGTVTQQLNFQNALPYIVEADSSLNLPIVGRVQMAGLNLKEAEDLLETKYADYFIEPYVFLRIDNRRITVFPGSGGDAKVIEVGNQYVTIVEALALAGGIGERGKAHKVKVFRGGFNNPEVYHIDMSTVEGLAEAKLHYVKANDVIYVEPSYFVGKQVLAASVQILGLITNSLATYFLVTTFATGN